MLVVVIAFSAMLNNIPVVVLFIPIMQALTRRFRQPPSRYMMLLSFASVLGGMTTLIGSSSNLLVSLELAILGVRPFRFFVFPFPRHVLPFRCLFFLPLASPCPFPLPRPSSR